MGKINWRFYGIGELWRSWSASSWRGFGILKGIPEVFHDLRGFGSRYSILRMWISTESRRLSIYDRSSWMCCHAFPEAASHRVSRGAVSLFVLQESTRYIVYFFFLFFCFAFLFLFLSVFCFLFLSESLDIMKRQLRSDRSSEFDWLNRTGLKI